MHFNSTKTFWIVIPVFVFFIFGAVYFGYRVDRGSASPKELSNLPAPGQVLGAFTAAAEENLPVQTVLAPKEITENLGAAEPVLSARAALVFDFTSGQVLYQKNSAAKLQIASLTKIMTALVALEDPNYSKPIVITAADQIDVSPELHLRIGDKVMPRDLIFSMLIGSANDAALAIGNHFPNQEEFLQKMNTKAAELGMTSTNFTDPKGFDVAGNYSSAADLYKLVNYALQTLPYSEVWKDSNYSFTSLNGDRYFVRNSNDLVANHPSIHSIKTGLSPMAMQNMIIKRDLAGHSIVSIILNSEDRDADSLLLTDFIFKNYTWPK